MGEYSVRALEPGTWDAFARMVERHNGVFGGCWCTWFHTMSSEKERSYDANRALKCRLVDEGRAHAALVMHEGEVVAWCQFGSPEELPNIYHRKQYEQELDVLPDYRITCIFVDKAHRRRGLSILALRGALDLIADAGGGLVEGYPHDAGGKRKSVLYDGTRELFERAGFEYVRSKGSGNCVMRRSVEPVAAP
ncbi:MAG: GNAT family N-acetyltransferase [Frankiales bacterium]|nr:GNAT family N-acetyltransferase [Frankiales bacterium]